MRKVLLSLAASAALTAGATAVFAQSPPSVQIPKGVFFKGQTASQYLARDRLLYAKVQNSDGQIIGDVEDLIVGPDNKIEGVIMGTGGFLGAGEKRLGVRLSALQISQRDGRTVIVLPAASKEVLDALEPYKRAEPKKTLAERAREKAQELSDKTRDSAGPAYERAKEAAKGAYQSAREQAGPAYEKAKEAAKTAYENARQQAGPAYEKAKDAAKDAYDRALAAAKDAYDKTMSQPPPADAPKQ
jgi:hypothetical protein